MRRTIGKGIEKLKELRRKLDIYIKTLLLRRRGYVIFQYVLTLEEIKKFYKNNCVITCIGGERIIIKNCVNKEDKNEKKFREN